MTETKTENKTNRARNFLRGASSVLVLMPRGEYRTGRGGFAHDAKAMRRDFIQTGRDMGYTLRKNGEAY